MHEAYRGPTGVQCVFLVSGPLSEARRSREHLEIAKTQYDKANAINDRAERIQAKSAALVEGSGKPFKVITPVLVVLVLAAGWLLFTIRP